MTSLYAKAAGVLLLIAIACFSTWEVQDWRYNAQLADQARVHQVDLTAISNAAAAQSRQALDKQQAAEKALASLDRKAQKEKNNALAENDKLRADVASGARRLLLAGSCRAGSGSVSGTTLCASLGDAGALELSPAVGSTVLSIRAGIIADQTALRAAQAYIRDVCR